MSSCGTFASFPWFVGVTNETKAVVFIADKSDSAFTRPFTLRELGRFINVRRPDAFRNGAVGFIDWLGFFDSMMTLPL